MAILSDSFSSFELTTQGKISASNTLRSVNEVHSVAQIKLFKFKVLAISETPQSNFLQRKLFTLNSIRDKIENINFINKGFKVIEVSDRLSVNKIILPLKAVLSTYETPYRVDALYLKSQVSTNVAPTNARENLYYATLAPGLRNKATYISSSSYDFQNDNFNSNRIENLYAQSLVSTNVAPTNARENLYYATLAQGFRSRPNYSYTTEYKESPYTYSLGRIVNKFIASIDSSNIDYGKINVFKFGDFKAGSNKMQDMASTKKAPVQFWS